MASHARPRTAPIVRARFEIIAELSAASRPATPAREPSTRLAGLLVNAPHHNLQRSTSLAGFMPRPAQQCIKRRDPCRPPVRPVFQVEEPTYHLTTSHKIHFSGMGKPRRRDACMPKTTKGLFSEVAELGLPTLTRTTSAEHFQQRIVPRMRPAFVPPVNRAPYSSVDDIDNRAIFRTTSALHFGAARLIVPRRRKSCRPEKHDHDLFFFEGAGLPRSTSHDAFQSLIVPKQRAPCLPPRNAAPYGSHDVYR